jgi:hypothetical protein
MAGHPTAGQTTNDSIGASWRPVDLSPALDGKCIGKPPVLLSREDGCCLLYAGKVHTVSGEPESLKTWLVLLACATVINGGGHVVFIDYEDAADSIAGRLVALGCKCQAILELFHYVQPDEPYGPAAAMVLSDAVSDLVALVVIDGVTEAMAAHGLDPNSNADVASFNGRLPRRFAASGATVVMIDHVTKNRESRGRYAIGAQHKLSAVDGAAYTLDLLRAFGHGQHGIAKIVVAKDRPGRVVAGSGRLAGMLHLRSEADGSVLASIAPPRTAPRDDGEFKPTVLMQRISAYIEANPGLSVRALLAAVSGNTDHKKLALELLVVRKFVAVEESGRAHLHKSIRPYTDSLDDADGV